MSRIRSFLLIAFGFSWAVAGVMVLLGVDASGGYAYLVFAALFMLGPAVAALVQHLLIDKAPASRLDLHPRSIRVKPLLFTVLLGVAIIPSFLVVDHVLGDRLGVAAFGHVSMASDHLEEVVAQMANERGVVTTSETMDALRDVPGAVILLLVLIAAVFAAFTVNVPFMLGEELGWRGYLFQATSTWSAGRRILFTGTFWGLWHAPLILMGHNYPEHPWLGIPLMVVFCILLAFLFDHCRTRVQSVWGPVVLHGLINGSAGATALFAFGGHSLVASPVGAGGFIAIALLVVIVLSIDGSYRRALWVVPRSNVNGSVPG